MKRPDEAARRTRNRLIEAEIPALRRYARVLAGDAEEAGELVQDTAARALARWSQWRGEGDLRPWLFAIMRSRFHQEARRRARWRLTPFEAAGEAAEPVAPPALDPLYLRNFAAALQDLTEDQRETLFLVAVEGLSYADAAALTQAPIGTVMSRLARARARLRAGLGGGAEEAAR